MRSQGGGVGGLLHSVVVITLAMFLISAMVAPAVAFAPGSVTQSSTSTMTTADDWRLEISTRNDPYRTGANNTTRWVNGTVSLVDSEAVDIVAVTLNGIQNESFEVPVEKPGTAADGEFNFTITLDRRVNHNDGDRSEDVTAAVTKSVTPC